MNDWNIQSRAHACEACAKPFADKQSYHTLLFDEKQDFRRMDICDACWQGQFSQGATDRKGFISYWQGTYEAPPPAPPDAIQKENAETLLRKIIELQDEKYAPAAYILAVMLERKRLLKVKEQIVRDPNLQLDQLDDVQRQVADLLEHGFNTAAPAAQASATESVEAETMAPAETADPPAEPVQA